DYAVGGADVDGADFLGASLPGGTISFLAGETSRTLTIEVAGDSAFEADEDFTVVLSNPSSGNGISSGTATGSIVNDDPQPAGPTTLVDENFDGANDTGGFTYSDGVFGGANPQADASGNWSNGSLALDLGGGANSLVSDMSGGWQTDFVLAADMDVALSFSYEMILASDYESDEYSQVLVSIDGGTPILIDELIGDGNGGPDQTTGLQSLELDLGVLDAGTHSLAIGGINNKKTWSNETTEITIDDVLVTGTLPGTSALDPASFSSGSDLLAGNLGQSESELLGSAGT
ncbi:MAG: hypothetical protein RH942_11050, partial [Kiloniellaceae bacterium]